MEKQEKAPESLCFIVSSVQIMGHQKNPKLIQQKSDKNELKSQLSHFWIRFFFSVFVLGMNSIFHTLMYCLRI